MAYAQVEPFGYWNDWAMAAVGARTTANTFRGENQKAYELTDFMPSVEKRIAGKQRPEELLAAMMRIKAMAEAAEAKKVAAPREATP